MILGHLTPQQARVYIDAAKGDHYDAALSLAYDRAVDGEAPDAIEVHHALYLILRAIDLPAPSWDTTRVNFRLRNWFK